MCLIAFTPMIGGTSVSAAETTHYQTVEATGPGIISLFMESGTLQLYDSSHNLIGSSEGSPYLTGKTRVYAFKVSEAGTYTVVDPSDPLTSMPHFSYYGDRDITIEHSYEVAGYDASTQYFKFVPEETGGYQLFAYLYKGTVALMDGNKNYITPPIKKGYEQNYHLGQFGYKLYKGKTYYFEIHNDALAPIGTYTILLREINQQVYGTLPTYGGATRAKANKIPLRHTTYFVSDVNGRKISWYKATVTKKYDGILSAGFDGGVEGSYKVELYHGSKRLASIKYTSADNKSWHGLKYHLKKGTYYYKVTKLTKKSTGIIALECTSY